MARKKDIVTEADVKDLIKKVFDKAEAWSYAPVQNGLGVHGIPDRVGCIPVVVTKEMVGRTVGLFVAVESKRPGRRGEKNAGATGQQLNQMHEIIEAGGVAMLADGQDDGDFLAGTLARGEIPYINWCAALDVRTVLGRK